MKNTNSIRMTIVGKILSTTKKSIEIADTFYELYGLTQANQNEIVNCVQDTDTDVYGYTAVGVVANANHPTIPGATIQQEAVVIDLEFDAHRAACESYRPGQKVLMDLVFSNRTDAALVEAVRSIPDDLDESKLGKTVITVPFSASPERVCYPGHALAGKPCPIKLAFIGEPHYYGDAYNQLHQLLNEQVSDDEPNGIRREQLFENGNVTVNSSPARSNSNTALTTTKKFEVAMVVNAASYKNSKHVHRFEDGCVFTADETDMLGLVLNPDESRAYFSLNGCDAKVPMKLSSVAQFIELAAADLPDAEDLYPNPKPPVRDENADSASELYVGGDIVY